MEVNVLEFRGNNGFLIKGGELNRSFEFTLNEEKLASALRNNDLALSKGDVLCYIPMQRTIVNYERNGATMSIDDYKSKPQYYDDENTDNEVMDIIANKKELEGFKPVYEKVEPKPVSIKVVGFIEDVGSKFISYVIHGSSFKPTSNVYSISARLISMDEYKKLSKQLSDHAKFEISDRNYLRFTKINGSYSFGDYWPFGDRSYVQTFTELDKAKEAEEAVRVAVRDKVNEAVFKKEKTSYKDIQILHHLKLIKKSKTVKSKNDLLDMLITDVSEYLSKTD